MLFQSRVLQEDLGVWAFNPFRFHAQPKNLPRIPVKYQDWQKRVVRKQSAYQFQNPLLSNDLNYRISLIIHSSLKHDYFRYYLEIFHRKFQFEFSAILI